jgi:hypothetical protein
LNTSLLWHVMTLTRNDVFIESKIVYRNATRKVKYLSR